MFKRKKQEIENPCPIGWIFYSAASCIELGMNPTHIEEVITFAFNKYQDFILNQPPECQIDILDQFEVEEYCTSVFGTDFGLSQIRDDCQKVIFQYILIVHDIEQQFENLKNNPDVFILLGKIDDYFPTYEANIETKEKYKTIIKKLDWINKI